MQSRQSYSDVNRVEVVVCNIQTVPRAPRNLDASFTGYALMIAISRTPPRTADYLRLPVGTPPGERLPEWSEDWCGTS